MPGRYPKKIHFRARGSSFVRFRDKVEAKVKEPNTLRKLKSGSLAKKISKGEGKALVGRRFNKNTACKIAKGQKDLGRLA